MSLDLLGEGFDLHGGGDDLVFPHHENERAQAEGAGHPFARHWIHAGMVTIGGEKMSKSLGNFTTSPTRSTTYGAARVPARRAPDALPPGRRARCRRSSTAAAKASSGSTRCSGAPPPRASTPTARRRRRDRRPVPRRDGRRLRHAARAGGDLRGQRATPTVPSTTATRPGGGAGRDGARARGVLGLDVGDDGTAGDDAEIDALVRERDEARAARDFARADAVRDELAARGIKLEDTPERHHLAPMSRRERRTGVAAGSGTPERRKREAGRDDSGSRSRGGGRCGSSWSPDGGRCTSSGSSSDTDDARVVAELAAARRGRRGADPARARRPDRAPGPHRARRRASSRSRRRCRPPTSTTCSPIPRAFLVALDGVTDPQNLGAVMRSAETAGATGMVLADATAPSGSRPPWRRRRPARSSTCPVAFVSGIPGALDRAKRAGVWCVGLDADGDQSVFELSVADAPLVLVLGAEGRGLSRLARDAVRRDRVDPDARSHRVAQRERGRRGRVHRDRAATRGIAFRVRRVSSVGRALLL